MAARSCIIEIGRELAAAKARVGHGNWEEWLRIEFDWKPRTAQSYMQVFETFGKNAPGADLSLVSVSIEAKALYALAAPSVPPEVRQQAIEQAERGDMVTLADAERMVEKAANDAVASIPAKIEALRQQEKLRAEQAAAAAMKADFVCTALMVGVLRCYHVRTTLTQSHLERIWFKFHDGRRAIEQPQVRHRSSCHLHARGQRSLQRHYHKVHNYPPPAERGR